MSFTNFTTGKSHSFGGQYLELARPSPRSGETVFWPPETKGPELSLKRSFSNRDCKPALRPRKTAGIRQTTGNLG